MTDVRNQLIHFLRQQEAFAADLSPLYRQIFAALAELIEQDPGDPVARWLVELAAVRPPLEVSLLVPAALHQGVLAGQPALTRLAQFYPSVGGVVPHADSGVLPPILYKAINEYAPTMEPFIRTATVQTNETARGLVWLLPLMYTNWTAVHLLELGASAGLNLLADWRSYRMIESTQQESSTVDLGRGQPVQFVNRHQDCPISPLTARPLPHISSRVGLDLAPFTLHNESSEQTLTSFIWADQTARIARLREGIVALRNAEAVTQAPELHAVRLPDQLDSFLQNWTREPLSQPIVLFNTVVSMYLEGGAAGLREVVARWASAQPVPVLWLQWEPPVDSEQAPHWGWLSWTADLWQNGHHDHFDLGWIHAHGAQLQWLPDLSRWSTRASNLH